jgi:glycosyltransferase involved in cell wall biosynthesis
VKILIVSQYYWPETIRINDFVSGLKKEGLDIYVLTGQPNYPEGKVYKGYAPWRLIEETHNQVKIFRVPIIPRGKKSIFFLSLNYISFIISASFFGAYKLRGHKFDYILTYGTSPIFQAVPAIFISRLKSSKKITWVQDLWPESLIATGHIKTKSIVSLLNYFVGWIYKHSDLLLVQSQLFIPSVKKLAGETQIQYFPQPGEEFHKKFFSKSNNLKFKRGFNVVFAGNLGSVQSLDTILDAAKILKNYHDIIFYLVGTGSEVNRIYERISTEKIQNVKLLGKFSPEKMANIYAQASALLLTLSDHEILNRTIPGKLQTYLAQSKPIIASINGESARIIYESKAGIVCSSGDSKALAKIVLQLKLMDKKKLSEMGKNAHFYYKTNFDIDLLIKKFIYLIGNIK